MLPGQYGEYGGYDFLLIKVGCFQNIHIMMMILVITIIIRWKGKWRPNWPLVFPRPTIYPPNLISGDMAGVVLTMMKMVMTIISIQVQEGAV